MGLYLLVPDIGAPFTESIKEPGGEPLWTKTSEEEDALRGPLDTVTSKKYVLPDMSRAACTVTRSCQDGSGMCGVKTRLLYECHAPRGRLKRHVRATKHQRQARACTGSLGGIRRGERALTGLLLGERIRWAGRVGCIST